ncbi:Uncharacterised protein [Klebsiella pneumoniae]|nr:Uncharacterised protein [Klebsiella pneumoniae]
MLHDGRRVRLVILFCGGMIKFIHIFYSDVFSGFDWVRMRDCVCSRNCASVGLTGERALPVWLSCRFSGVVAVLPGLF